MKLIVFVWQTMKLFPYLLFFLGVSVLEGKEPDDVKVPDYIRDIVAVRIPSIEVRDVNYWELINYVAERIVELDPRDPPRRGISFLYEAGRREPDQALDSSVRKGPTKINYSARNVRVDKVFTDLAKLINIDFHVTSVGVVITPKGKKPFPNGKAKTGDIYFTYEAQKDGEK